MALEIGKIYKTTHPQDSQKRDERYWALKEAKTYEWSGIYYNPQPNADAKLEEIYTLMMRKKYEYNQNGFDQACKDLGYKDLIMTQNYRDSLLHYKQELNAILDEFDVERFKQSYLWNKDFASSDLLITLKKHLVYWCLTIAQRLKRTDIYKKNKKLLTDIDNVPYIILMEKINPMRWFSSDIFTSTEQFNRIKGYLFPPYQNYEYNRDSKKYELILSPQLHIREGDVYYDTLLSRLEYELEYLTDQDLIPWLKQYLKLKVNAIDSISSFYKDCLKSNTNNVMTIENPKEEALFATHLPVVESSFFSEQMLKIHLSYGIVPQGYLPFCCDCDNFYTHLIHCTPIMQYPLFHSIVSRGIISLFQQAYIYLLKNDVKNLKIVISEIKVKLKEESEKLEQSNKKFKEVTAERDENEDKICELSNLNRMYQNQLNPEIALLYKYNFKIDTYDRAKVRIKLHIVKPEAKTDQVSDMVSLDDADFIYFTVSYDGLGDDTKDYKLYSLEKRHRKALIQIAWYKNKPKELSELIARVDPKDKSALNKWFKSIFDLKIDNSLIAANGSVNIDLCLDDKAKIVPQFESPHTRDDD